MLTSINRLAIVIITEWNCVQPVIIFEAVIISIITVIAVIIANVL